MVSEWIVFIKNPTTNEWDKMPATDIQVDLGYDISRVGTASFKLTDINGVFFNKYQNAREFAVYRNNQFIIHCYIDEISPDFSSEPPELTISGGEYYIRKLEKMTMPALRWCNYKKILPSDLARIAIGTLTLIDEQFDSSQNISLFSNTQLYSDETGKTVLTLRKQSETQYYLSGYAQSVVWRNDDPSWRKMKDVKAVKLTATDSIPGGTSIKYEFSRDGGTTWYSLANNTLYQLSGSESVKNQPMWRITLSGGVYDGFDADTSASYDFLTTNGLYPSSFGFYTQYSGVAYNGSSQHTAFNYMVRKATDFNATDGSVEANIKVPPDMVHAKFGLVFRLQSATTTYMAYYDKATNLLKLAKYVSGVLTDLGSASFPSPANQVLIPDSTISDYLFDTRPPYARLYEVIDETTPDDNDYICAERWVGTSYCEIGLSDASDPGVDTNHVISIRYSYNYNTGGSALWKLKQGSTVIATRNFTPSVDMTTVNFTLTTTEASAITNYNDLRLYFELTGASYDSPASLVVSWARMTIPGINGSGQHKWKLSVSGTSLQAYLDDTLKISATDSAIAAAGRAGIFVLPSPAYTGANGYKNPMFLDLLLAASSSSAPEVEDMKIYCYTDSESGISEGSITDYSNSNLTNPHVDFQVNFNTRLDVLNQAKNMSPTSRSSTSPSPTWDVQIQEYEVGDKQFNANLNYGEFVVGNVSSDFTLGEKDILKLNKRVSTRDVRTALTVIGGGWESRGISVIPIIDVATDGVNAGTEEPVMGVVQLKQSTGENTIENYAEAILKILSKPKDMIEADVRPEFGPLYNLGDNITVNLPMFGISSKYRVLRKKYSMRRDESMSIELSAGESVEKFFAQMGSSQMAMGGLNQGSADSPIQSFIVDGDKTDTATIYIFISIFKKVKNVYLSVKSDKYRYFLSTDVMVYAYYPQNVSLRVDGTTIDEFGVRGTETASFEVKNMNITKALDVNLDGFADPGWHKIELVSSTSTNNANGLGLYYVQIQMSEADEPLYM